MVEHSSLKTEEARRDGFWSAVRMGIFGISVYALLSETKAPPISACTPAGVIGSKSLKGRQPDHVLQLEGIAWDLRMLYTTLL